MIVIGRQIRAARSLLGITRATLSKRSGVPQTTVKAVESEVGDPRSSTMEALARALHRSGIEFIVDGTGGGGPGLRLRRPLATRWRERR